MLSMIEVIYYCSYTGSPVGFLMGKLMYNPNQHENYVLSTEFGLIDPTIRKCFENGMFHAAIGVLPNNGSNLYFLLIKKLLSKGKTETAPDNYYLDLAIITKNKNTFSQWIKNGSSPQEIADAIRDTMEIDGHNDNGFTVRPHELNNLLDKSFGTLFHGAEFSLDNREFAIRTTFGDPDPDDLAEGLNLSNRTWHFTISKFDKKWAIYHKKQKIWDKKPYRNRLSDDEFQNIVNRKTNEELQDDIDSIKNDIDDISNSSDGSIPPQKKQSWLRALWENLKRLIRYLKEKLMNAGRSLGIIRESLDDLSSDVYCYLTEDTDMAVTNNGQTLTSAIVNEIGGQTPEQLYAWMHKNISYDKSLKTWHLKSAAELYQTKTGNCHDQSYFETFLLHSWGYVTGQLYFVEFSDSSPIGGNTHTLTWYKDDQMKYHWIENAWENYAGIHGPYDSINDLKDAVLDAYLKDNDINQGKMDGIAFGTFSSYRLGMNLNQYARSWKLTDDRRINAVNESVGELLDWIDRFVHDDEVRESYLIEGSHDKQQALKELRMREVDILNYMDHIRRDGDLTNPKTQELYQTELNNLRIIRRDIDTIKSKKPYDLSIMKKYRQYDEGVSAGLTGKQLWHYYTYMDFRPSSTCIEDTDVMIDDRIMDVLSEKKNDGLIDKIFRFHEYMGNFKYGLAIDGVIDKTQNTTSADYDNLYRVVGPKDFEKQGGGICWDFVTYQADYFKKHFKDIDYTTWYIVFDAAPDYPSHTFMTFKFNDQYIYFESSFKGNNDIWVAPSEDDIINFVMDSMDKHASYHKGKLIGCKYYVTKYNALDKRIPGCSCDEFMELMKTYDSEVKHSFKKSYSVSKFQPSTAVYESEEVNKDPEDEHKPESKPKQVDKAESDKNGVRRKKLYIAFIEWCKEINPKNTFGSIFDKDAFHVTYPFVPEEMRYFYRLANPMLCVLQGNLTFFAAAELRKLNSKNSQLQQMMIFAATENDFRVFNNKDKKVYRGIDKNGALTLQEVLGETFDLYIQNMIKKGDILNAPLEESVEEYAMIE